MEKRGNDNRRRGWKLDKYMFIHMVEKTFEEQPDPKWYVFIETDSYVFWPNMIASLSCFDSSKPLYLGSVVSLSSLRFAHDESGYVLSNAAMHLLLSPEMKGDLAKSWDGRMKSNCCRDLALGTGLKEMDVGITVADPLLNGYKLASIKFGPGEHWCQSAVTEKHVLPVAWRYVRSTSAKPTDGAEEQKGVKDVGEGKKTEDTKAESKEVVAKVVDKVEVENKKVTVDSRPATCRKRETE